MKYKQIFYHIFHRTFPFKSFPSRLVLCPSSPVPPSVNGPPPIPSHLFLSHVVLLFFVPSSCSITCPSRPVPILFFLCRLVQFCHILTRLVPCHPDRSCSIPSLLVPPLPVFLHTGPSLPSLFCPIPSRPKPSHLVLRMLVLFNSIYSHPHLSRFPLLHIPSSSVISCFRPPSPILVHFFTIKSLHIRWSFVCSIP